MTRWTPWCVRFTACVRAQVKFGWDEDRIDGTLANVLPSSSPGQGTSAARQSSLLQWFTTFEDDEKVGSLAVRAQPPRTMAITCVCFDVMKAADIRSSRLNAAVALLRKHMLRRGEEENDAELKAEISRQKAKERELTEHEAIAAEASQESQNNE